MPLDSFFGVFFSHRGKFDGDAIKEAREYFSKYGDVSSVVPTKYDRVYVNFKSSSQAEACINDPANVKYGLICRGVSAKEGSVSSIDGSDGKAKQKGFNGKRFYKSKKNTKKENQEEKSSQSEAEDGGVGASVPSFTAHPTDMPRLIPVRLPDSQSHSAGQNGIPRLVPAGSHVPKPGTGIFLNGIVLSPSLLAMERKYSNQVIVSNLSMECTVQDISEMFEVLRPIYVSKIRPTNVKKKFLYCCVKFPSEREAVIAVQDYHGAVLHGCNLFIVKLDEIRAECRQLKMRLNGYHA